MNDYAILTSEGEYTIFEYNKDRIKFATSDKIMEWDHGYIVVNAEYKGVGEVEEYIDLVPILENLYYDVDKFLEPIKEVRIEYAS